MSAEDPQAHYEARASECDAVARGLQPRESALANLRLVTALAFVACLWFAFGPRWIAPAWVLAPTALFIALAIAHDRVIRARSEAERRAAHCRAGLARLADDWAGRGDDGLAYRPEGHPYADDLDIFGKGSLFELISLARTPAGAGTLASWLCQPAEPDEIRARQAAVDELRPTTLLREDLSLLGESLATRLDPSALVAWGAGDAASIGRGAQRAAQLLVFATLAALGAWIFGPAPPAIFLVCLVVQGAFAQWLRGRVRPVLQSVERPTRDLALLAQLLERIEEEELACPRLAAIRARLDAQGDPPSREVARLRRLADLLDARRNQLFAPIAGLLLWGTQIAFALEAWRARCGPALGSWVSAAAEFEALVSISGHAYENPDAPFPDVEAGAPRFEATALGHPLLARSACVRNDVRLATEPQILVMSGSNMSGKSTMLRTVGINAVLAQAGAPVRADALSMSPLAVGASIRVNDSLQTGTSHFYAEIQRLSQVVSLADEAGEGRGLLFLLDEILAGTNSHDRRIGAEALLEGLQTRGAIGIATTHDLALTEIAHARAPALANVHFADHLEDGELRFDYTLAEGVVQGSNALALMRRVGLDV